MPPPISLPDITIDNGATTSNIVNFTRGIFAWVKSFTLYSPTQSGVVTAEIAKASAGPFVTLQSGSADVTIPASKGTVIDPVAFKFFRLKTTVAPGADEVYEITGREDSQ